MRDSKTGKYTSLTAIIRAENAGEIISYYKRASKIEGVKML
jgi:putative lipoic acid-binding regulatory protein